MTHGGNVRAMVIVTSVGDFLLVKAMYGVKIVVDTLVTYCSNMSYDLVVLPVKQ
jgi:hypothetical protein